MFSVNMKSCIACKERYSRCKHFQSFLGIFYIIRDKFYQCKKRVVSFANIDMVYSGMKYLFSGDGTSNL